jgi:vitamin K-dependent gamma-carboxylase
MKLRDKAADARFFATDPASGRSGEVDPLLYLTDWQYDEMASRPDMIVQFVQHIEHDARQSSGVDDLEVTAQVQASLNGREFQRLLDPKTDLSDVEMSPFMTASFIEPLTEPLP